MSRELPTLREYSELSEESRQVMARAQQQIDSAAAAADALDP